MPSHISFKANSSLASVLAFTSYLASIPLANWLIENFGEVRFDGGPHVVPVGFGQVAPSGVLAIGFALVSRDVLQNRIGRKPVLLAMALGVLVSLFVNPDLAIASGVAFALGETADFLVYSPLRGRNLLAAVSLSGIVGGVVDSLVFLQIAFNSTEYWQGQVLGKAWMAILGGLLIVAVRRHRTTPQTLNIA